MKDQDGAFIQTNVRTYHSKCKSASQSQIPAASKVQCMEVDDGEPELTCTIQSITNNEYGIDPKQDKMMKILTQTAKDTNQEDKLLMFPPHGKDPLK